MRKLTNRQEQILSFLEMYDAPNGFYINFTEDDYIIEDLQECCNDGITKAAIKNNIGSLVCRGDLIVMTQDQLDQAWEDIAEKALMKEHIHKQAEKIAQLEAELQFTKGRLEYEKSEVARCRSTAVAIRQDKEENANTLITYAGSLQELLVLTHQQHTNELLGEEAKSSWFGETFFATVSCRNQPQLFHPEIPETMQKLRDRCLREAIRSSMSGTFKYVIEQEGLEFDSDFPTLLGDCVGEYFVNKLFDAYTANGKRAIVDAVVDKEVAEYWKKGWSDRNYIDHHIGEIAKREANKRIAGMAEKQGQLIPGFFGRCVNPAFQQKHEVAEIAKAKAEVQKIVQEKGLNYCFQLELKK